MYCIVAACTVLWQRVLYCGNVYCIVAACTVLWQRVLYCGSVYCIVAACTVLWQHVLYCGSMYCIVAACTVFWTLLVSVFVCGTGRNQTVIIRLHGMQVMHVGRKAFCVSS